MKQKDINFIKKNWDIIPDSFKENLKPRRYSDNIKGISQNEKHIVILLVDRQKPSVEQCYDYDEERIGINRDGLIIWGFDSGCSCPSPWDDNYDKDMYSVEKTWKEFKINLEEFDKGILEECDKKIKEIRDALLGVSDE